MVVEKSYVNYLECSRTGEEYAPDRFHNMSNDGAPLLVRYDLGRMRREISRDEFVNTSVPGIWRYQNLLPLRDLANAVSLGEIRTPLIPLNGNQAHQGFRVAVKDEGYLPTGSFKARGLSAAVSLAKEFGVQRLVVPTAGNAGAALAAYAAKAGILATVLCPADAIESTVEQTSMYTEQVILVNGLINDCGELVRQIPADDHWREISTFKEPYRVEGKKTIAFELAEQCHWKPPEYIFYPTGGGVGLVGIWKGFRELQELGWLEGELPKMVAVQAAGCSPVVDAWAQGREYATACKDVRTGIHGMRVPAPFADRLMLQTLRESNGMGITISDEDAREALIKLARTEGQLLSLEGAAVYAAFEKAVRGSMLEPDSHVVLINSASGLKNEGLKGRADVHREFDLASLGFPASTNIN